MKTSSLGVCGHSGNTLQAQERMSWWNGKNLDIGTNKWMVESIGYKKPTPLKWRYSLGHT
jgi:hypothetical protein